MNTIAEKLSYLNDTKNLFKDKLNSLGAEITNSTTFRNYLNWLDTFYGEVSDKTDLSQNGVIGRTSQETTSISSGDEYDSPSPDYPQPINNLTGNVPYKVSGKNLLNKTEGTYESWVTIDITDLIEDGVNYYASIDYKNLIGSCVMRIDYTYNGTTNYIWGQGGSDGTVTEGTMYKQFSIPNHDQNTNIYLRIKDDGAGLTSGYYSNWLLAKSDTAISYEPHIEPQIFNIPLGDIELCKIDTYEDKIYSSNGRFYLYKNIGKVVLNGSEDWLDYINATVNTMAFKLSNIIYNTNVNDNNLKCDKFTHYRWYDSIRVKLDVPYLSQATIDNIVLNIKRNLLSSENAAGFKSWLSTHNTTVYYPLATPTTTEITQENYPSLYNALKQIQDCLTAYKINKEFILNYDEPNINY